MIEQHPTLDRFMELVNLEEDEMLDPKYNAEFDRLESEINQALQLKQRVEEMHFIDVDRMFPEIIKEISNHNDLERILLEYVKRDYAEIRQLLKDDTENHD